MTAQIFNGGAISSFMLTSFVRHGNVKTTKTTTPRSENDVKDGSTTKPKMHTTVVAHFDDVYPKNEM